MIAKVVPLARVGRDCYRGSGSGSGFSPPSLRHAAGGLVAVNASICHAFPDPRPRDFGGRSPSERFEVGPMPFRLLRFALSKKYPEPRMFREPERLKDRYDVVIIGGGGHGLAAAYYLARDYGMTDVAVLEKGYIGGGNTGRNTAIVRSNYLTVEGVKFYDESVRLFSELSQDLDLNLFYSERGHFTLAHTDSTLRTMRWRAEVNKHLGVNSYVITPEEIHQICPYIDLTCGGTSPIVGALYHPPGAIVRHDAVAWGYAREADRRGVEIHQKTRRHRHRRQGRPGRRRPDRPRLHQDAAGCSRPSPATRRGSPRWSACARRWSIQPLQACVTEPLKPWLDQHRRLGEPAPLRQPVVARRAGHGGLARPVRTALASARRSTSSKGWPTTCSTCSRSCRT